MKQPTCIYKKLFILISITIFAFGNALAATMHDNEFYLYYGTGIDNLSMDYIGKGVSKGQPSVDGITVDNKQFNEKFNKNRLKGVFKAGRHKTEIVSNAFINAVDARKDNKCYSILQIHMQLGAYVCPSELNFYIVTTLYINGSPVINPVLLAQGNNGRNNWWVGSIGATKAKNTDFQDQYFYLEVKTISGDTYRIREFEGIVGVLDNSVNSFIIDKVLL